MGLFFTMCHSVGKSYNCNTHTHTHKILCPLSRRASVHTDGGSYLKHTAHRSSPRCAYRKDPELFVFSVKVVIWFLWQFWFDVNS